MEAGIMEYTNWTEEPDVFEDWDDSYIWCNLCITPLHSRLALL